MKVRYCNILGCTGEMRPMRELRGSHRLFRCVICGYQTFWLANPKLDGCFGELHKVEGGFSGLSMLSDPIFTGYKRRRRPI
jgi:hypothetical protein